MEYKLCDPRPIILKGLAWNKFWSYNENQGYLSIPDDEYVEKANKLASAIADRLKDLKSHKIQEVEFKDECELKKRESDIKTAVFLDCAPEDLDLSLKIKSMLKESGVKCVVTPMERSDNVSPIHIEEIVRDIEIKILGCDAILIFYDKTSPSFASKQIMDCLSIRKKPLKILALHKGKDNPKLGYEDCGLDIYECPPEKIETYLPHFIEKLT